MPKVIRDSDEEARERVCEELWRDICRSIEIHDRTGNPMLLRILAAQKQHYTAIFTGTERPVH